MKCLTALLIVSAAAALPLPASALDYNLDTHAMAMQAGPPALPGARRNTNHAATAGLDPTIHPGHDNDEADATPPHSDNDHAAAPSNPRHAGAATQVGGSIRAQGVLSWQSLLPGSIQ